MTATTAMTAQKHQLYIPKASGSVAFRPADPLPTRPTAVGPVFDSEHSQKPLQPFNEDAHNMSFPDPLLPGGPSNAPEQPLDFSDRYLFPSLTRNERLRLTMLWYYTREMLEDEELMGRIREKVSTVAKLTGWEHGIVGLVNENLYTRVATFNLPLAILPRRESTCAHTINQPNGSVFYLKDMSADWRFKHSPHVEIGGLKSYAGAPLRCRLDNGEDVILGSLCIATSGECKPLLPQHEMMLPRFADMITDEIVSRMKLKRQLQQRIMSENILKLQKMSLTADLEKTALDLVNQAFPAARVSLQDAAAGEIYLTNRNPVPFSTFQNGLWEDGECLDELINTQNQNALHADHTIRAIVGKYEVRTRAKFLVIDSLDVQLIFDDVDIWFVEKCSLVICNMLQERSLMEALDAKEAFMRGITHQLRTPLHGILGSAELLAEELELRETQTPLNPPGGPVFPTDEGYKPFLTTIKNSGRELMSTVNNMIKLSRWAGITGTLHNCRPYDLQKLESDIFDDVTKLIPSDDMTHLSLLFDCKITPENSVVTLDITLVKECLQSLLLNAVQFTSHGSVVMSTSTTPDFSTLTFDIEDTGCGICPGDQARVFEAYEKADPYTRGTGLGLTLADKIATSIGGSVALVSSQYGKGSHFRVEFTNPGFACSIRRVDPTDLGLSSIPQTFCLSEGRELSLVARCFAQHLERNGIIKTSTDSDLALNVTSFIVNIQTFKKELLTTPVNQTTICLVAANKDTLELRVAAKDRTVLFFSGPFFTSRLDQILQEIDTHFRRLHQLQGFMQTQQEEKDTESAGFPATTPLAETNTLGGRALPIRSVSPRHPFPLLPASSSPAGIVTPSSTASPDTANVPVPSLSHSESSNMSNTTGASSTSDRPSAADTASTITSQTTSPHPSDFHLIDAPPNPAKRRLSRATTINYGHGHNNSFPCSKHPMSDIRALLVDDNPINLRIVRMFCEKRGIPYVDAMDGYQAIARYEEALNEVVDDDPSKCKPGQVLEEVVNGIKRRRTKGKGPFNLIMMDLQMPHCDGVRACAAIREIERRAMARIIGGNGVIPPPRQDFNGMDPDARAYERIVRGIEDGVKAEEAAEEKLAEGGERPKLRQPSVLMMITGQDSATDKSASFEAGANEFFVKPVNLKFLDRNIANYFDKDQ